MARTCTGASRSAKEEEKKKSHELITFVVSCVFADIFGSTRVACAVLVTA